MSNQGGKRTSKVSTMLQKTAQFEMGQKLTKTKTTALYMISLVVIVEDIALSSNKYYFGQKNFV